MADESTGLYKVKASIDGNAQLATGSRVKLTVTSQKTENAMTIPVDAVYYENSEPYVYVYNEGTVARKDIKTGIFDSTRMEVKSGLTAKDQVVKSWSSELYDGAKVRLPGESGGGRGRGGEGGQGGADGNGGQNGQGGAGRSGGSGGQGGGRPQ